jgi:hypothetical protein
MSGPFITIETWDACGPAEMKRLESARFVHVCDEYAFFVVDGNMVKVKLLPEGQTNNYVPEAP